MKEFWRKFWRKLPAKDLIEHGDGTTKWLWLITSLIIIFSSFHGIFGFIEDKPEKGFLGLIAAWFFYIYLRYLEWGVKNRLEEIGKK